MGKSLQEALADLLGSLKADQKESAKQQIKELKQRLYHNGKPVEQESRQPAPGARRVDARTGDESFTDLMAKEGIEPASFGQNKASRRSNSLQFEENVIRVEEQSKREDADRRGGDLTKESATKQTGTKLPVYYERNQSSRAKAFSQKSIDRQPKSVEALTEKPSNSSNAGTSWSKAQGPEKKPEVIAHTPPSGEHGSPQESELSTVTPSRWYELKISESVVPNVALVSVPQSPRMINLPQMIALQVEGEKDDEREVNIGLDFGTSSIKVVIGDSVIGKAFAVPFFETSGLDQYLLPSRVWHDKERGQFTLTDGGQALRNLKLNVIKPQCPVDEFSHAAALLALVIMHARAWLLCEHKVVYQRTEILWKLTLGFPAQGYDNKRLINTFQKLAAAAWQLSLREQRVLPDGTVEKVCQRALSSTSDDPHEIFKNDTADVEIDVVPELSAQIYGFLTSEKFDKRAKNIFMIVDVGAGTIDSSIFRVVEGKARSLSFEFFANSIEFNGVVNLHKFRISWLSEVFNKENLAPSFLDALENMEGPTDYLRDIPEDINGYFDGVTLSFPSEQSSPDRMFFEDKVLYQVLAGTLKKAAAINKSHTLFNGMPFFICGGGSRMQFYQNIQSRLISHSNASWLNFVPRKLEVPDILAVPGVVKNDFDRLSVAFGLSFIRVGEIIRAVKQPPPTVISHRWVCPGCGSHTTCYCG